MNKMINKYNHTGLTIKKMSYVMLGNDINKLKNKSKGYKPLNLMKYYRILRVG